MATLATMTTATALLKELYEGRLADQLQSEIVAGKRIERTSNGVVSKAGGKYVDFPIRVGRTSGIGSRLENEALPAADSQKYDEVHVPLTKSVGRFRVTGDMMELAETDAQSFVSAVDQEVEGCREDAAKDYERQWFGDGSGLLATVVSDAANAVVVDNVQYLEVGMQVDILTRATGAVIAADRTITAINEGTKSVTYGGADGTSTAADGIYRMGNFTGAVKRELSGFELVAGSATAPLHNINPATQPVWAPVINANGGTNRPLSESDMIKTCDLIRRKGGGKPSVIFYGLGVRVAYFNLLTQQRRYADTKSFDGGFQGLPFHYGQEIPCVDVLDVLPNRMFFISEPKYKVYRNREWHFGAADGNTWKWVTGYDAYEGFLKIHSEAGTNQRNAHGALKDITEG